MRRIVVRFSGVPVFAALLLGAVLTWSVVAPARAVVSPQTVALVCHVQPACVFAVGTTSIDVDVVLTNNSASSISVANFNFEVYSSNAAFLTPSAPVPNAPGFGCTTPIADTGAYGSGATGSAVPACVNAASPTGDIIVAASATATLGTVHFSAAGADAADLILTNVSIADGNGVSLVDCTPATGPPAAPTGANLANCSGATASVSGPTATPTNTSLPVTATPTRPPVTSTPLPFVTITPNAGTQTATARTPTPCGPGGCPTATRTPTASATLTPCGPGGCPTATNTPTASATPTPTLSPTPCGAAGCPTATATATPCGPGACPTATATPTPCAPGNCPTATATPIPCGPGGCPTATITPTPTLTPTPCSPGGCPTATNTPTPCGPGGCPTATNTPTASATPTPTTTPTPCGLGPCPTRTSTGTVSPTLTPTRTPTPCQPGGCPTATLTPTPTPCGPGGCPTATSTPTATAATRTHTPTPTSTPNAGTRTATALTATPCGDTDCDGVPDLTDNCPNDYNPDQKNSRRDFIDLHVYGKLFDDTTVLNSTTLGDACNPDIDGDGFANDVEAQLGPGGTAHAQCTAATGPTDPLKLDTDGDTFTDRAECLLGTAPINPASHPAASYATGDAVHAGLPDTLEVTLGTNPNNPDTDGDRLLDGVEFLRYGSNPLNPNTDGDTCSDGKEAASLNDDTNVNTTDLLIAAKAFASSAQPNYVLDFDVNRDGKVNTTDLLIIAKLFGAC